MEKSEIGELKRNKGNKIRRWTSSTERERDEQRSSNIRIYRKKKKMKIEERQIKQAK